MADTKLISPSALSRKLKPIRGRKKIVFTNGCFDLMHRGHVEYLSKAKACGGRPDAAVLVVGLNSDASVRRLKGPARPILPLADRAALLGALAAVDFVVPFSEDTPLRLIQSVRPDVLVKGADYQETEIVGAREVQSWGGRVTRIRLTAGRSTTAVIQKIQAMTTNPGRQKKSLTADVLIVIPARYGSTRFPGKALADLRGKSVLQRVYEKARWAARKNWKIVIATDDRRIFDAARGFGAEVAMTQRSCRSGSDRCAEIAQRVVFSHYPIIVNLQGDEPFQPPANIALAVKTLLESECPIATLAAECPKKDYANPGVAKVAISKGRAVYFSRSLIPFHRDRADAKRMRIFKHIGLYVFRRDFLIEFSKWPETSLEQAEKLEQLRVLENGRSIAIAVTRQDSMGIDTPADLAKARRSIRN